MRKSYVVDLSSSNFYNKQGYTYGVCWYDEAGTHNIHLFKNEFAAQKYADSINMKGKHHA